MVLSASIHTATMNQGAGNYYFFRNGLFAALGVGIMLTFSRIPYNLYQKYVALILLAAITVMALVLVPPRCLALGAAARARGS